MDHFLTHGRPPPSIEDHGHQSANNNNQQQHRRHRYYDYILYIDMDVIIMDLDRWNADWLLPLFDSQQ